MFHRVQTWTSRLSEPQGDSPVLLAFSRDEAWREDARARACVGQLRAMMVARRRVDLTYHRAIAAARGRGRTEDRVKQRVRAGLSRARQVEVLCEDHEAAMARLLATHMAFEAVVSRLRRSPGLTGHEPVLLSLCLAEERAWLQLLDRYPDDRARLEALAARWRILAS